MSNPRTGINALPSELLCNILWLAIDRSSNKRNPYKLMRVCRLWRDYIEGSPSFWTYISADDGPTRVRRALERSKGAMLDLYCRLYKSSPWKTEAFMTAVGPHIARWRSLKGLLQPWSIERELGPLITTQPPCLEMLDLSLNLPPNSVPVSEYAVTLFGGAPAPPTLRTITLSEIPVSFEPLGLSSLVSLTLKKVPNISTLQLLEILRRCTELESLELEEREDSPRLVALGAQASNIQSIELPRLVYLSFQYLDYGGANSILSNIRIPNHRRRVCIWDVTVTGEPALAILFTPDIAHLLHPTMPTADIPFSVIRVDADDLTSSVLLKIYFRGINLTLNVRGVDDLQEILRWFADGLGSEAAECPVHITLRSYRLDPVRAATVPTPLAVKHLYFTTNWESEKAIYTALARAPDSTSPGRFLPQLECLSVRVAKSESRELLFSMLRSRYGRTTLAGETDSKRPVNLRSIELRHFPLRIDGLEEEVRGILGHEIDVI